MNKQITWRSLVIVLLILLGSVVTWGFARVAELPDKYVQKTEMGRIESKLDRVEDGVNEINRYLRGGI